MAIPPKFSSQLLDLTSSSSSGTKATQPHTLEVYLDYVCPFSAKIFNTLVSDVIPLIKKSYTNPGVRLIFRQQVQPWHPSSTLVHEAGVAVLQLGASPEKFWEFSEKLFKDQKAYFDVNVVNESRNDTYKRLAKLAGGVEGIEEDEVYKLLVVPDKPDEDGGLNIGNKVTNDLKLMIRAARVVGVHVSPTVYLNGLEQSAISSGWDVKQWDEWLKKNVV